MPVPIIEVAAENIRAIDDILLFCFNDIICSSWIEAGSLDIRMSCTIDFWIDNFISI
jgi:hypothetical protein